MKKLKGNISGAISSSEEIIEELEKDEYIFKEPDTEEEIDDEKIELLRCIRNKLSKINIRLKAKLKEKNNVDIEKYV